MTESTARWISDLRIAASFVRSVQTGKPRIDIELQDLADQIEDIAETQTDDVVARPENHKPVDEAA